MSTGEISVMPMTALAAANLSSSQYYAVALGSTGTVDLPTVQGQECLGLLRNAPTSGKAANIGVHGIFEGILGGTVAIGDILTCSSAGKLVKACPGEHILGRALEAGVLNDVISVLVDPHSNPFDTTIFTVDDDCSSKQYYAMSVHTDAGQLDLAGAGEGILGILQNAPAADATARVRTYGRSKFVAGTAGVTVGDLLEAESGGKLITEGNGSAGAKLVAVALETVAADATGLCFIKGFGVTIA